MGETDYIKLAEYPQDRRYRVTDSSKTILVIDEDQGLADNLKELIEFMDAPDVVTATPKNWQKRVGRHRLGAMFVGPDLSDEILDELLTALEEFNPEVPVVMIQGKT